MQQNRWLMFGWMFAGMALVALLFGTTAVAAIASVLFLVCGIILLTVAVFSPPLVIRETETIKEIDLVATLPHLVAFHEMISEWKRDLRTEDIQFAQHKKGLSIYVNGYKVATLVIKGGEYCIVKEVVKTTQFEVLAAGHQQQTYTPQQAVDYIHTDLFNLVDQITNRAP